MKIGIMQPYFFPYIGYFQLIDAVDIFVNLDHVSFMKRSYMVRNKIKDDININVPVIKGSQNKSCCETYVNFSNHFVPKFIKKLKHLYSKEKNYEIVLNILERRVLVIYKSKHGGLNQPNLSVCQLQKNR